MEGAIDVALDGFDERLTWLRDKVCTDIVDIEKKIAGDELLYRLEKAFEHSAIEADLKAVLDMERRIIARSGYQNNAPTDKGIELILGYFEQAMQRLYSEVSEKEGQSEKLPGFQFTQAEEAMDALGRAREAICSPEKVVIARSATYKKD